MNKALEKLGSLIANNLASLVIGPTRIRREGMAWIDVKEAEILRLAQADVYAKQIKKGKARLNKDMQLVYLNTVQSENLVLESEPGRIEPTMTFSEVAANLTSALIVEKLEKDINVSRTIIKAAEELADKSDADDQPVNDDWFQKWRQYSESVSEDKFQNLWARVLAGEIVSPGTYSPRTLHLLHNLTEDEAKSIEYLSKFCSITHLYKTDYLHTKLSLDFLMDLEEIGIITAVQTEIVQGITSLSSDQFFCNLPHGNRTILMHHSNPSLEFNLDCYGLTKIGREILSLCRTIPDEEHLRQLAQILKRIGLKVQLADFQMISKDRGASSNAVEV